MRHEAEVAVGHSPSVLDFLAFIYYADGLFAIDSAAVHAACAYDCVQEALYNDHKKKMRWYSPLDLPNTHLVLSDTETENIDDFSTFSEDTVAKALAHLLQRLKA